METSLTKFKENYRELLLRFLWRQWSALGVSGYAKSEDDWIIDPEALLLFSSEIARHDPRHFDEILDWLGENGDWINQQRLSRMRKDYDFGNGSVIDAMAESLKELLPKFKWGSFAKRVAPTQKEVEALYPDQPAPIECDPIFQKFGWLRGPVRHRSLSTAPRPNQAPAFLFKLRSLFGRQSRAEVMAWLLAHETGHPAEIARQTGYFSRSVQDVLNEMERSGHICATRHGREKYFAIQHADWHFLITWQNKSDSRTGFPQWIHWPALFSFLECFHRLLENPKLPQMSERMQAIEMRRALETAMEKNTDPSLRLDFATRATGADFLDRTLQQLSRLLG
ncbi:MAG: hypothetical protein ACLFS4_07335 [Opitutales bacterium]